MLGQCVPLLSLYHTCLSISIGILAWHMSCVCLSGLCYHTDFVILHVGYYIGYNIHVLYKMYMYLGRGVA